MNLANTSRLLHPRRPFRISRGWRAEVRNVFIRVEHGGLPGYGETAPIAYYDETWESVLAKLEGARDFLATLTLDSVANLEAAWTESWHFLAPSRAAQCALDVALWDWLARQRGISVSELAWGEKPRPVTTFCTIGLSDREELMAKIEELRGYPQIKIKSSRDAGLDPVRTIRQHTAALLAVDANCAWEAADLPAFSRELAQLGVVFIEQPLPSSEDAALPSARSGLPLVADESCVTEDDVERAAEHFSGCNIKLVKCGGITPARRMVTRCRALGLRPMVGCMLESSALISAGAAIAQRADFADLDGAWLLGDDPFEGWRFDRGVLFPPSGPGLGAIPREELFLSRNGAA